MGFIRYNLDKQGRLKIPNELLTLTKIDRTKKVALCESQDEKYMFLRNDNNIEGCYVIYSGSIDCKNRFIIPKAIRDNFSKFEIKVKNGELLIKPTK